MVNRLLYLLVQALVWTVALGCAVTLPAAPRWFVLFLAGAAVALPFAWISSWLRRRRHRRLREVDVKNLTIMLHGLIRRDVQ